ncbi:phage shock protein A [Kyrpidia spormannii]|uniref:Phage shock protein A n=2 Tax=Kyrpidia spormannii TaxID=2055160 RepID=A0ACA8ZAN6_9BACL|nr:PspA/IM30 family protein [Kyrpidia spormannii]ATY85553.1 phage shock protein A [Kyrpidia spormannii]CAB3393883.1 Phage shock protein A [Kyrpidia spormannii]
MGLFKRLRDISLANINAMLDRVEDPVKLLDQYLRDMEEDLQDAEEAVAKAIAVEKKLKAQFEEAQSLAEKRAKQAEEAVLAGNDDLARRALADKREQEAKARDFQNQYQTAKANADALREKLAEMKEEIGKMRNKRDTLVARAQAAKAQKEISQAMSGIGSDSAMRGFQRMEDKVLQLEAEAEASGEVYKKERSLDDEFNELRRNADVEDELAALKAKLNKAE